MSIIGGFFDSTTVTNGVGNKAQSAAFFARYFASFVGNGVYASPATCLQVTAGTGLNAHIGVGSCWINGYYGYDDSGTDVLLTADASVDKTYRIIVRLSTQTGTFAYAAINSGVALNRTSPIYEIALADVTIRAGATAIAASDIADLRLNSDVCGIVAGVITQITSTAAYSQLTAIIAAAAASKAGLDADIATWGGEWDEWFDKIKDQLTTDAAGNLQTNKADKTLTNVADGAVITRLLAAGAVTSAKLGADVKTRLGGYDYGVKFL